MTQKPLNLLLSVMLVLQMWIPTFSSPPTHTQPDPRSTPASPVVEVVPEAATAPAMTRAMGPIGGEVQGIHDPTIRPRSPVDLLAAAPQRLPIWRSAEDYPYLSSLYTHSDILIFSYADQTQFQVTNAGGAVIWQGVLDAGQHRELTPGGGIYSAAATHPFSVVVGDQLTQFVWGYYAMDQNGRGLSTLLHTYQADWSSAVYDPHFVVFGYQDNTQVIVKDSGTGATIWSGVLNDGQHYDNRTLDDRFLTVTANKPVAALSYTDQGYFVPSDNGTFAGHRFHTYVGDAGGWPEFLNIMAYDNTGLTLIDSVSGDHLWSGSLSAGEAISLTGLNGRFVTLDSSGVVTLSVQPAPYQSGNYYHSLYAQDSTGTGIGTNFILPAIYGAALVFFAYDNNSVVTIRDERGNLAYYGALNQGDWDYITTASTYYTIRSTGRISAVLDWGNKAGADFAPVFYSTFNVQLVTPNGDNYHHGETMIASAYITRLGQSVLDATVVGRIEIAGPSDTLTFQLNDEGRYGDATAGDAIYSAEVPLPAAAAMPDGNYDIFVTAQRADPDGVMQSGTGVSTFTLSGALQDAPSVTINVTGPSSNNIYSGNTVKIRATVVYSDGVDLPDTTVTARITRPNLTQEEVTLAHVSAGVWEATWPVTGSGRFLFDVRATPPQSTAIAAGYGSAAINVLASTSPLSLTVDTLPGAVARGAVTPLGVAVRANGQLTDQANVFAEISPGDVILPFTRDGKGHYAGYFHAAQAGSFTITIYASAPYQPDNSTVATLAVSNAGQSLLDTVDRLADMTGKDLETLLTTSTQVAQDGDWFRSKTGADLLAIGFDLTFGVLDLYGETGKVLKSAKVDGLIRGYTPGLDNYRLIKGRAGIDGRAFQSWASRTSHALRESLLDPHFSGRLYPKYLGPGVFSRALIAYAAAWGGESIEELAVLSTSELAQHIAQALAGQPLVEGVLGFLKVSVADSKALINDYAQATQSEMPVVNDEEAYEADLVARMRANSYISGNSYTRNGTLFWAQDNRESNESVFRQAILALLHQALRILVGVLTGGPGVLVVDTVWTGVELYADVKKLQEDVQMWNFAANSLIRSIEDESRITDNAIAGLVQLRLGRPPQTAKGQIVALETISRRGFCWRVICEQEVVARITIRNTGPETARFRPEACFYGTRQFGMQFFSHCIKDIRLDTHETDEIVTLAPSQTETIELVFKNENGHDIRPPDGTRVNYYLYAENNTGIFLADTDSAPLEPTAELREGLFATTAPDASWRAAAAEAVIPHPIYLAAIPGGDGVDQYFHLEAINGYGFPIQAMITQAIPDGLVVTIPGGGLIEGDTVVWKTIIQPHEGFSADFAVAVPGSLVETIQMPPAELSFYLAQEGETLTFFSSGVAIQRRPPWTATAELPPRLDDIQNIPLAVTNQVITPTHGLLRVQLLDQQGDLIRKAEMALELCGFCQATRTITLTSNQPPGVYALVAEMEINGDTVEIASQLLSSQPEWFTIFLPNVVR